MPSGVVRRAVIGALPQRVAGVAKSTQQLVVLPRNELSTLSKRPTVVNVSIQSHFMNSTEALKLNFSSTRTIPSQTLSGFSPKVPKATSGLGWLASVSPWGSPIGVLRHFSTSSVNHRDDRNVPKPNDQKNGAQNTKAGMDKDVEDLAELEGFEKSERASKAEQINLRARLSHDGKAPKKFWSSLGEITRLFGIAKPERKPLSFAIVMLLISSTTFVALPMIVGKVLNTATAKPIEETEIYGLTLYQFFAAFGIALTIGAAANFGRIVLLRIIGERVVTRLRSQLFRRTYTQDAEFFDANRIGDLISRLSSDTIIVGKSITQNLSDGMRSLINSISGFALMAWISPSLTAVIMCTAPILATASFVYSRITRRLSRKMQQNLGTLTKIAEERLGNVKTSQAFAGERQEVHRYNKQVRKIFDLGKKQSIFDATYFSATSWIGNMTIIALLWYGGNQVRYGFMSPGDLTMFVMYAFWAGGGLFGFASFYSELMKGVGAATRIFELQDRQVGISSTKGLKVTSVQGPIKFENVSFAYPTRPAVSIFNGLNFEIPSGANVCIVGPSGGGKSTVSSLLLRFYNPTSGTISINGVNTANMNAKALRRRVGMVAQEPVLFSGTVAENIAYAKPNATRSEIVMAAQKANCGFISDFPKGLETQVGPRGAQLSGGQKQRIAIARALIKDPDILILDEATSALDAESETAVNLALAALLKSRRRTTISIAHRLSTIKRSDMIIVLSNQGTVAEIGSFNELIANENGEFYRLIRWQQTGADIPDVPVRRAPELSESEIIGEELEELDEDEDEDQVREREEGDEGEKPKK
ncbi:hypothetical protein F5B20DRAFT_544255 [Whalleya microplaca]|nr:hypothetical protein F5B20DRAFT_544255 [Whalleya microplaca]